MNNMPRIKKNELVNRLLDSFAPIEANLRARLSVRTWTSYQTNKVLQASGVRNRGWISRLFERAMQPDGWLLSLMFALTIIGLPQLIIFIISPITIPQSHSTSDYSLATILNTAWQVLGAITALSLAIIVYLTQFIHDRKYERRAFPLFFSYTRMMFIVIFGLLSVLSLGVAAFAFENPDIPQRDLHIIVAYDFLLFGFNIGLTIYLYVRTYHLA